MFLFKIVGLTLVIFLVLNYSKLRRGAVSCRDLILPFSLSFALAVGCGIMKAGFIASLFAFVILFAVCFGVLHYAASPKK